MGISGVRTPYHTEYEQYGIPGKVCCGMDFGSLVEIFSGCVKVLMPIYFSCNLMKSVHLNFAEID